MKKITAAILCGVLSLTALTSCGNKLDGEYLICTKDGEELEYIEFDKGDEEFEFDHNDGEYKITDKGKLRLKFEDKSVDAKYGGKYDYEILDKKEATIYIDGLSEKLLSDKLNPAASTIMKALNSALTDMDIDGDYYSGTYLFSADKKHTVISSSADFDTDKLLKNAKNYFDDLDKYEFFAYISYGYANYVFCSDDWKSKAVGIYGAYASDYEDMTLQEIFDSFEDSVSK